MRDGNFMWNNLVENITAISFSVSVNTLLEHSYSMILSKQIASDFLKPIPPFLWYSLCSLPLLCDFLWRVLIAAPSPACVSPFLIWEKRALEFGFCFLFRYSIKTNMVMLLLTTIVWIFGCQIFWYNAEVKYHLVFGLAAGIQVRI